MNKIIYCCAIVFGIFTYCMQPIFITYHQKFEQARKESFAEIEKLKSENAALQSNAKKAPPDSKKERLKFYLEECQRSFNSALEVISAFEDGEQRQKMKLALTKTLKAMSDTLSGIGDDSGQP